MIIEPDRLKSFAERYTAAWCSKDPAQVAACYASNGSLSVNCAVPAAGRIEIGKVAEGFMTAFPDLELTMDNLTMEGGRIAYHWTFVGTNSGPGGTGRRVRFSGFEEWKIDRDGLIAESQGHFDDANYRRQLD